MASSATPFSGVRDDDEQLQQQLQKRQPSSAPPPPPAQQTAPPSVKKRRNLPGNPYPDAEVIALSPRTLLATNRFVCEVCNKGFQREQNLQLHRRGHNLPWKLRQRSAADRDQVRRRVYLCPEPTCVHHDPARALGDLTGVKKHFCRKHGEKKWKCDKCAKRYAVQSDWKAHSKVCGTREYRCDCGTLFSRRDSFITHRAFCDALSQETTRLPTAGGLAALGGHIYGGDNNSMQVLGLSQLNSSQITTLQEHFVNSPSKPFLFNAPPQPPPPSFFHCGGGGSDVGKEEGNVNGGHPLLGSKALQSLMQLPDLQGSASLSSSSPNIFNLGFFSDKNDQFFAGNLNVDEQLAASRYSTLIKNEHSILPHEAAQLSATALMLQKAAPIPSAGGSLLLGGFSSGGSGPGEGFTRSQMMDNEAQIQYLMNSLAAAGSGINGLFGSSTAAAAAPFDMEEVKYSIGGSEGLTRDFLGVGSLQQQGIDLSYLGADMRSGTSNRSFSGGSLM